MSQETSTPAKKSVKNLGLMEIAPVAGLAYSAYRAFADADDKLAGGLIAGGGLFALIGALASQPAEAKVDVELLDGANLNVKELLPLGAIAWGGIRLLKNEEFKTEGIIALVCGGVLAMKALGSSSTF